MEVRLHFRMLLQEQMPLEVVEVLGWLVVQLEVVSAEDSEVVDLSVHYQAHYLHLVRLCHLLTLYLPSNLHHLSVQQLLLDVCETPPAASTCQLSFLPLSCLLLPPFSGTYLPSSSI